jgi:hypothetical protein
MASVTFPFLNSASGTLFEWSLAVKNMNRKWWFALVLLCLAATTACPPQDTEKSNSSHLQSKKNQNQHLTVPEGGSSLVYVLGAGVTCLGAILVRARSVKPKKS